jgi:hypothetical protein
MQRAKSLCSDFGGGGPQQQDYRKSLIHHFCCEVIGSFRCSFTWCCFITVETNRLLFTFPTRAWSQTWKLSLASSLKKIGIRDSKFHLVHFQ